VPSRMRQNPTKEYRAMRIRVWWSLLAAAVLGFVAPTAAEAACCYFSAQNTDILQPAQKVFLTYDPVKQEESFTVQPKFEGNALDFGMVIPTPTQPKLHEMPRDFFKHLAVFTLLKKRDAFDNFDRPMYSSSARDSSKPPTIKILEVGVVGSLDYKIIEAGRADDLYKWLKDNKYHYAGDEATLDFYVQKKWLFTVMKIDTMQMKKNQNGTFDGEVTPTRFSFNSDKFVYPLKITQISVKDKTEALFYVQAPTKMDLPGTLSCQHTWVPMLLASFKNVNTQYYDKLPGKAGKWLATIDAQIPGLLQKNADLGFAFAKGQRPKPNKQGRTPTTMEWAKKLTDNDIKVLQGKAPYSNDRLQRQAPQAEIQALQHLLGHLQTGWFITKFRKIFTRGEMNDDLLIVPALLGDAVDESEYEEILPASPP
jgi:hypothetical protein